MVSVEFYEAPDGDDGPFSLCSATAWNEFAAWVKHQAGCPLLVNLVDEGAVYDTASLSKEMADLATPTDPEAKSAYALLITLVGIGDPDETVEVLH